MYFKVINNIEKCNDIWIKKANDRLDELIKPIKSLGTLEEIAAKMCNIQETLTPTIDKRIVVIMASDNGVCSEGVASAPQSVTAMQTINFLRGITGISVIAKANNSDIKVIDVGVLSDISYKGLEIKKIGYGTRNIAKEAAMTKEECIRAIEIGIECIGELVEKGYSIIGTGEMGIGNTTTSSSLLIALTGCSIDEAVGRGAGLSDNQFIEKKSVIKKIIDLHSEGIKDPFECLRRVGGYDIAALVGLYLGAGFYKVPIVIDGFISIIAALCAYKINPNCRDYMFASHISMEKGYMIALNELGLNPMLNLNMRLGEGTGCPLAFNIIDTSTRIIKEMGTFKEGNVNLEDYKDHWRDEE